MRLKVSGMEEQAERIAGMLRLLVMAVFGLALSVFALAVCHAN
jgi:hypothetical protein